MMKKAAFLAITMEHTLYEHYHEIEDAYRHAMIPVAMMLTRWDGMIGFPGGIVEENESAMEGAIREFEEEVGVTLSEEHKKNVGYVCTHADDSIEVTLFSLQVDFATFQHFMQQAIHAPHFMVEGTAIAPQLMPFPREKGLPQFLKNNLAFAVKEELHELFQYLAWDKTYGSVVQDIDTTLLRHSVMNDVHGSTMTF